MKGIDVSENNGVIDWQTVKNSGIEFAMVRSSYGKNGKDEMFLKNVNGAHSVGLLVGAYHYSYALNTDDALLEAQNCRAVIEESGILLELPVFYDMEDADGYKSRNDFLFDRNLVTEMCKTFIGEICLDCGVYASLSWLEDYIDWQSLGCAVWNAQWGSHDDLKGYMWQYTDGLCINGKYFDGNIKY